MKPLQKFKGKKGLNVAIVPQLGITLLVLAVVLAIGVTILQSTLESSHCPSGKYWSDTDGMCYNDADHNDSYRTLGFNATYAGIEGVETLSGWQNTFAVIIAAAVVIGIIASYLYFRRT